MWSLTSLGRQKANKYSFMQLSPPFELITLFFRVRLYVMCGVAVISLCVYSFVIRGGFHGSAQ